MRAKQEFLDTALPLLKPEFHGELNVVEDAAHLMNQSGETTYTLPAAFATTGVDETFVFEKKPRPATDNPNEVVEDYFYIGREK